MMFRRIGHSDCAGFWWRIIQRKSKSNCRMKIIRLAGCTEGALQSHRRQRPRVAANRELAALGIAGFRRWVIRGGRPLGCAASQIMHAPGRFVLEVFPLPASIATGVVVALQDESKVSRVLIAPGVTPPIGAAACAFPLLLGGEAVGKPIALRTPNNICLHVIKRNSTHCGRQEPCWMFG